VDEEGTLASVMLLILGEDLEPEVVTRALMLFPDQSWRRGDRYPTLAQRGVAGTAQDMGGWKKFISEDWLHRRLEEQLEFWATFLQGRSSGIDHLSALGYELALDCFVAPNFPFLVELSDSLQMQLGALHLNIDMHFFADESPDTKSRN
jgi:hypothetical protein